MPLSAEPLRGPRGGPMSRSAAVHAALRFLLLVHPVLRKSGCDGHNEGGESLLSECDEHNKVGTRSREGAERMPPSGFGCGHSLRMTLFCADVPPPCHSERSACHGRAESNCAAAPSDSDGGISAEKRVRINLLRILFLFFVRVENGWCDPHTEAGTRSRQGAWRMPPSGFGYRLRLSLRMTL